MARLPLDSLGSESNVDIIRGRLRLGAVSTTSMSRRWIQHSSKLVHTMYGLGREGEFSSQEKLPFSSFPFNLLSR